jgi:hypothetical protein
LLINDNQLQIVNAMSISRPLPAIQADIASAEARLAELARERRRTRAGRLAGIVADFDAGFSRTAVAEKWGVDYAFVARILWKAGRTERTRCALGLSDSQRVDYDRLLRQGVRTKLARAIALRGR